MNWDLDVTLLGIPPSENAIRIVTRHGLAYSRKATLYRESIQKVLSGPEHLPTLRAILQTHDVTALYAVAVELRDNFLTKGFLKGTAASPYAMSDVSNRQKLLLDALSSAFGKTETGSNILDDSRFVDIHLTKVHVPEGDPSCETIRLRLRRVSPSEFGIPPEALARRK